jgi:hypothetical protein
LDHRHGMKVRYTTVKPHIISSTCGLSTADAERKQQEFQELLYA